MATPLESWAAERVGTPFVEKGRTRAGYDCAGFLLAAYREVFGLELPTFTERYAGIQDRQGIARAIDEQRDLWRGVPAGHERPGDAILLRVYGLPIHVGLVLGRRRFAHVMEGLGVSVEEYGSIRWSKRVLGFYRPTALETQAWA